LAKRSHREFTEGIRKDSLLELFWGVRQSQLISCRVVNEVSRPESQKENLYETDRKKKPRIATERRTASSYSGPNGIGKEVIEEKKKSSLGPTKFKGRGGGGVRTKSYPKRFDHS